ncbi:MAG TPA: RHS repeat-associated core domain-containing protein [Verrucomicrobiae bacterium]
MVTTQVYDKLNRLQSLSSRGFQFGGSSPTSLPLSSAYVYDGANQRKAAHGGDGSYWIYEYDRLGQVTSGRKYWSDGSQVSGQQFTYAYDDIGNRTYTRDYQNKYTQRTVPPVVNGIGMADAATAVTVNGLSPARKGEYFHRALTVNNFSAAQYVQITTSPAQSDPLGDEAFLARDPEALGYDADGNLTSDGRWTYEWDGENRLHTIRSLVGSPAPERRIIYEYDYLGRRIRQTVWNGRDDGQGTEVSDVIYVYDRWNVIAELDANNSNARLRTYVWGLDLSGSRHGAGGVGGLLKVTDYVGSTTHHFVSFDGNGNVLSLTSGTTATEKARYDYGPFGEPIRGTGVMARKNPFRFSTKFTDNESELVYYGYRYYNAVTGRWLSRDPIGEEGGSIYSHLL